MLEEAQSNIHSPSSHGGRPEASTQQQVVEQHTPARPLPSFTTASPTYAHEIYRGIADDSSISDFLEETDCYDSAQKRWSLPTPSANTTAANLLSAVCEMLQSIVGSFVKYREPGVEREVLNTFGIEGCDGKNEDGFRACPELVVRAAGPSFQVPRPLDKEVRNFQVPIGFSNMAAHFSVKADSEVGCEKEIVDEMRSYARLIFHEQPNRFYVRSLSITETHVRLVHFDRAGAQITPPIDIHQHPATLIRLVAGLASTNEKLLGLDDSVQWIIVDGRKEKGTVATTGPSGELAAYPIIEEIPVPRDSIRGRGTTCWKVQDPETGEEYVIKESWRPVDRAPESDLLLLVKGVPGVVQMVSCERNRGETKDFRCPETVGQYHNRVATRVTMKSYGKSVVSFTSVLQLLCAIRDAMAGHQRLSADDLRILHRDVSHNNILLGNEDAPEGERGVLIDLDMAFRATNSQPTIKTCHNIGTRVFQSLSVLDSAFLREQSADHTYLDDLESFFFLMAYIFLLYRPDGSRVPSTEEGPSIVWGWGAEDTSEAVNNKSLVTGYGSTALQSSSLIHDAWGPACGALFDSFLWWLMERNDEKAILASDVDGEGVEGDPLAALYSCRDEHYATVLKMFDDAIEAVKAESSLISVSPVAEPKTPPSTTSAVPSPISPPSPVESLSPKTPPPETFTTLSLHPSPSPPTRKRRGKRAGHPSSPRLKGGCAEADFAAIEAPVDCTFGIPAPVTPPSPVGVFPPTTPPQSFSALSPHTSPVTPNRKRRSGDGEHPDSPPAKIRRAKEGLQPTSPSS